jgi:type II secretory pathway pseudopilin PulG
MRNRILHPGRRVKLAFTVLEVLIAMGIFAVGFAAVAAIFPTAILLQKQTVDDVLGQQVARNAQALLEARGLSCDDLNTAGINSNWATDQRVYPLPAAMLGTGGAWTLSDRSYPSTTFPVDARKLYWVPLVRNRKPEPVLANIDPAEVVVYVFVLQREPGVTYDRPTSLSISANPGDSTSVPLVAATSVSVDTSDLQRFDMGTNGNVYNGHFLLNPGDQILDCFGGVHTIQTVNANSVKVSGFINPNLDTGAYPNQIWFAVSDIDGRVRPTRRILTLTSAVKP